MDHKCFYDAYNDKPFCKCGDTALHELKESWKRRQGVVTEMPSYESITLYVDGVPYREIK